MLLAIDPGDVQSAWVVYNPYTRNPIAWDKEPNEDLIARLGVGLTADNCAIEMIASYGMPVGAETFETCVWIGRFTERWMESTGALPRRLFRREVKLHLCESVRAKDSNVRQAIIDRYGASKEIAVGRKATPGPLYGMKADVWQALGVAITASET